MILVLYLGTKIGFFEEMLVDWGTFLTMGQFDFGTEGQFDLGTEVLRVL